MANISTKDGLVSFDQLKTTAKHFGFQLNGFHFSCPQMLSKYSGAIVELENEHFVAVLGTNRDGSINVKDNDSDVEIWSQARLDSVWTGNVLIIDDLRTSHP